MPFILPSCKDWASWAPTEILTDYNKVVLCSVAKVLPVVLLSSLQTTIDMSFDISIISIWQKAYDTKIYITCSK